MTDLVIIIVSYNTRPHLQACLRSLHTPAPKIGHEIVVVDNGSEDGSVDTVRADWPRVRVIETGDNIGYARANNLATRATDSNLLLFLNSDTIVPAGAVDCLVAQLRTRPDAAIVGPRLVDPEGRLELSYGRMLGPLNEINQRLRGAILKRQVPVLATCIQQGARRARYTDWVSGACLLVHRCDAVAAGLLDERFFLYGEDVDFCAAVRRLRRRVLFTPDVEVIHARGRSGATAPTATWMAYRRSHVAFYEKHHPGWAPLLRLYLRLRGQLPQA